MTSPDDLTPNCELCGHPVDLENEDFTERYTLTSEPQPRVQPLYYHELCAAEAQRDEITRLQDELTRLKEEVWGI